MQLCGRSNKQLYVAVYTNLGHFSAWVNPERSDLYVQLVCAASEMNITYAYVNKDI